MSTSPSQTTSLRIALFALRELHLPVLEPVYRALQKHAGVSVGFVAPAFQAGNGNIPEEGVRPGTIQRLLSQGFDVWGTKAPPHQKYDAVVTADACVDRIEGWGPVVCVGHGTISKNIYFIDGPLAKRESYHAALCVPGPWYTTRFGDKVHTHILPTGFPKMDEYAEDFSVFKQELFATAGFSQRKKTILFAPTYNPEFSGLAMLLHEWARLDSEHFQVVVKLHGATSESERQLYRELCAQLPHMHYAEKESVVPYMRCADIVISDVSSAFVEAYILGVPVIVVDNPQMESFHLYNPNAVEFLVRDGAYRIKQGHELHSILAHVSSSDSLAPVRQQHAQALFPALDGQNATRAAQVTVEVASGKLVRNRQHSFSLLLQPESPLATARIRSNLQARHWPDIPYTYSPELAQEFQCHLLAPGQLPPLPLVVMTGENNFISEWDVVWDLHFRWNSPAHFYGPLLPPRPKNLYQQYQNRHDGKDIEVQRHFKYIQVGVSTRVESLVMDMLWIPEGIPPEIVRILLQNPKDVNIHYHAFQSLARMDRQTKVAVGLYGSDAIPEPEHR